MYKTKLQELCQQNRWGMPVYSSMKDGLDHCPSFKASVFVHGLTFDSIEPSNSSKHAQNLAAKLAFLHFTSSDRSPSLPAGSSTPTAQTDANEQGIEAARFEEISIPEESSVMMDDLLHLCKSQLKNYAQRKQIDLPVFTHKIEGPPHAPRFKSTVLVDGQSFDSPGFFCTLKEAEQVAAKVALMSLSLDSFEKVDSSFYKNLLQELAQKEGFSLPTYNTKKSDGVHPPAFFSTVMVKGKEFHGSTMNSKKLAEQDAAKVAYIALKEHSQGNEAEESINKSNYSKSNQNIKQEIPSLSKLAEGEDEAQEHGSYEMLPFILGLPPSEEVSDSSPKHSPSSPTSSLLELSALSISESEKENTPETSSYLLSNKVRVYTSFPNTSFPEGTVVVPVREDRWVAMSLEFPNESP